jgi:hypothetical protein
MTVEVEKTGAAVGFLDPECLCSTTLNNTDNTLSFSVSYMCNAFKLYAKKIRCLPLISVRTTGLQWWSLKDRNSELGRGEWIELIKIFLEGDRGSNKMNTASNTRLRLNYPSWSRPRSHWSATDPRNQQTTFLAKTHQHTQRKLARLAACATLVRPMACAGQIGDTGQTGG